MINRAKISTSTIANKLKQVKEELEENVIVNPDLPKLSPLLFVNGRLDRKKYKYIAKNFSLLESIEKDIKQYCKGLDLALLNFLIYKGIEAIKLENKFEVVEYSELEEKLTV